MFSTFFHAFTCCWHTEDNVRLSDVVKFSLIQVSVPVTFSETFNAAAITWNIDVCVYMHVLESIENLPPKLISAMQQQVEKMAVISSLQVSKWPHCFVFKPFTNDMHLLVFI